MRFFVIGLFLFSGIANVLAQQGESLPRFSKLIRMESNESFTRDSLNKENKLMFILFDPGCGHCQELGHALAGSLTEITDSVDIYFVSMQPKELVDGYVNMFAPGLAKDSRVHFLYDPEGEFILLFNPQNFPSTYIYAAESQQLLAHFDGESEIADILSHLAVM